MPKGRGHRSRGPVGASVLLIDDDPLFLECLARLVEAFGWSAVAAEDGLTGIELYRRHRPDVVLVDLLMPGRDGIETIVELRHLSPDAKIVAMSGGGQIGKAECIATAIRLGADAGLQKPFGSESLERLLDSLLHRRRRPAPIARVASAIARLTLPMDAELAR